VLQGLAVLNGLGGGLNAGAIGAVSAATLPDVENSARDMNILVTGPVFGQMALQAGGGYVIGWASDKWSPAVAWSVMWCATSSRVDASFGVYRCLSSFLISLDCRRCVHHTSFNHGAHRCTRAQVGVGSVLSARSTDADPDQAHAAAAAACDDSGRGCRGEEELPEGPRL